MRCHLLQLFLAPLIDSFFELSICTYFQYFSIANTFDGGTCKKEKIKMSLTQLVMKSGVSSFEEVPQYAYYGSGWKVSSVF